MEDKKEFIVKVKSKDTGKIVELKPRSMTDAELTALRDEGLDAIITDAEFTGKQNALMVDWIKNNVYKDFDFKDVAYCDIVMLARATYRKTYCLPEEIKN